ncbi:DedA family protein [Candidatus Falkowbacteria bacterium]|nr:DedA family protein [Candidatus Falkowbacteria bacterium]
MMMKEFFLALPMFIESLPEQGYLIILVFSILEALAFVGVLIPGTIIVIILGFFSFLKYWNFAAVFFLIFVGAVIGDTFSFWLGKKYGIKILTKLGQYRLYKFLGLDLAAKLLGNNERKSIVIGRLIGPSRAFTPFLVGSVGMRFRKFLNADILSVFLWSILYLGIGVMFGSSMPLIEKLINHIEELFLFFISIIFLFSFISRLIFKRPLHKEIRKSEIRN